MSGRRRRNDSKWDLKEDPPVSSQNILDSGWPRRGGVPIYEDKVQVGRGSDDGHNNGRRWSGVEENDFSKSRYDSDFSTREDMLGARSLRKDGGNNVDSGRKFDPVSWEEDGNYGTRMSPGLDDWRKRNRSRSPKDRHDRSSGNRNRNWRRSPSRSRSPVRSRKEPDIYDRNRTRPSYSSQLCKNFAAGRCRRGNDCRYLHEGSQHHNDTWDGRQRTGGSSKYSGTPDTRDTSIKSGRSAELCNHFQRGTCRRGSSCRYVHQLASEALDKPYQSDDVGEGENDKRRRDISDELGECEPYGRMGPSDRITSDWSTDSRLEHSLGLESKRWDDLSSAPEAAENEKSQPLELQEPRPTGKLNLDTNMTPDWNPPMQSPDHVIDEKGQNTYRITSLNQNGTLMTVHEHDKMHDASNQAYFSSVMQPVKTELPPMQHHHSLNENGANAFPSYNKDSISRIAGLLGDANLAASMAYKPGNDLCNQSMGIVASSSLDMVGNHQFGISVDPRNSGNILEPFSKPLSEEGKQVHQTGFVDPNASQVAPIGPPMQKTVSDEQIRQLTDLSASLAHLLGAGKELPQIYAAFNSQQTMDVASALSSIAAGNLPTPIQSSSLVGHHKQYDPLSDSFEPNKPEDTYKLEFPSVPVGNMNSILNSNDNQAEGNDTHKSSQLEVGISQAVKENEEMVVAEKEKEQKEKGKDPQDDGRVENTDGKDGDSKKTKEAKSMRAFKFALVEFVKELMKPTWKEGQMGKEAYKTIVKKVVDKVTGTMQGTNIPSSQEKIDQYLTFAKPKLTKLVQAYVEKFRKA